MRRGCRYVIVGVIAAACLIGLIVYLYRLNLPWTGFGPETTEPKQHAKTLWDWLQLLIIPAVLAITGYAINFTITRSEQKSTSLRDQTEHEIAADAQREQALQTYIDKMSELLLEKHLRESKEDDEVRKIAKVRSLTVLQRLDGKRKGDLIKFLHESGLIDNGSCIVDLVGADLRGVELVRANLLAVKLISANLRGAHLSLADLGGANLYGADLYEARLQHTDLSGANMRKINLGNADLSSAYLKGADLSEVYLSGRFTSSLFTPLRKVDLNHAKLSLANLKGANLNHAYLKGADLSGADLSGADLSGADLSEAKVTPEQLATVKYLGGATMPDGSIHP